MSVEALSSNIFIKDDIVIFRFVVVAIFEILYGSVKNKWFTRMK